MLGLGGCTALDSYKVASFFFDGVPDPRATKPAAAPGEGPATSAGAGQGTGQKPAAPKDPEPVIHLHKPYETGMCSSCHDPRSSNGLVREGNALCLLCHGKILKGKANQHVVAVEDCLICHNPHKSPNERILVDKVPDLCLGCHDRAAVEEQHGSVDDCRNCHNPHASDEPKLLEFK
jgi:predicted CXXCH cytochrome family protein